jgi:hypothetical protein
MTRFQKLGTLSLAAAPPPVPPDNLQKMGDVRSLFRLYRKVSKGKINEGTGRAFFFGFFSAVDRF